MAMINQEKGNHNSKQQLQDHSERGKKDGKKGERNRSQRQVWENGILIKYDDGMYFDETIPVTDDLEEQDWTTDPASENKAEES